MGRYLFTLLFRQVNIYFFLIFLTACSGEHDAQYKAEKIIHISHTRSNANPDIDSLATLIDYSQYDLRLLGGDMAYLSSFDDETMINLDGYFDLSDPRTLWALGNHDYSDTTRIKSFTQRGLYYAYHQHGITYIVTDTQRDQSSILNDQLDFLHNVLDTLNKSNFLILMTHKLIWMHDDPHMHDMMDSIPNGVSGNCSHCTNPNNFRSEIYPRLVDLQNDGVKVICLAGDIGLKVDSFYFKDPEGIEFLASGIQYNKDHKKVLLFLHEFFPEQSLSWTYKDLQELE